MNKTNNDLDKDNKTSKAQFMKIFGSKRDNKETLKFSGESDDHSQKLSFKK